MCLECCLRALEKPDISAVCFGENRASNSPNASVERSTIIVIFPLKSIMEEQIRANEFQCKTRLTSLHDSYSL